MAKHGLNTSLDPTLLDLQHVQSQLSRLDVLMQREIRRWQRSGQDPADAFRGLYISDADAAALLARPLAHSWGAIAALDADDEKGFAEAMERAEQHASSVVTAARQQHHVLRLEHLTQTFGLGRFDVDALLICLAPALDLRYERVYGYLQDDVTRKRPSISLILDLLCAPGPERLRMTSRFGEDAPLFKYHLLERIAEPGMTKPPLLAQTLIPDESVVSWLQGEYTPRTTLHSCISVLQPQIGKTDHVLTAEIWPQLEQALDGQAILAFYGLDQLCQHAAARRLAVELRRVLFCFDLERAMRAELPPERALDLALRDARLLDAIPYITSWDACAAGDDQKLSADLSARVCAHQGLVIVSGRAAVQVSGSERNRHIFLIEFPVPSYEQRHALWQAYSVQTIRGESAALLAGQFLLTSGQIRDAVDTAQDAAAQRGSDLIDEDLLAAARAQSSPRLATLARRIQPRYSWQDIVLPEDEITLLREITAAIRSRPRVLDEWGVGKKLASSNGVTILFAGPPGTGKTMAAEIIAAELGLGLYKIDLSTIVSKYIGETEKNLERVFSEAENSNAILFFDEADALFGKRSEVKDSHDRYANIEISYLLQRMEAYNGVSILATNLRSNLDEAFTRRLQFVVDFPFPDEADRIRIWQALFPAGVPRDPTLDFELLAKRFRVPGGNIRNIIVSASYLAAADGGQVTMEHLLHGARRELQKMGRLLGDKT